MKRTHITGIGQRNMGTLRKFTSYKAQGSLMKNIIRRLYTTFLPRGKKISSQISLGRAGKEPNRVARKEDTSAGAGTRITIAAVKEELE